MGKRILKNSRHVRWNWEESPDDSQLVRYHVIVVDDRDREGIFRRVTDRIQKYSWLKLVRDTDGKVKNSRLLYLFRSFDTPLAPREIDWSRVSENVKRDPKLYEREVGNIEDRVSDFYSGS